jgi:hypothetical protein
MHRMAAPYYSIIASTELMPPASNIARGYDLPSIWPISTYASIHS